MNHLGLVNFVLALYFGFRKIPPRLQDVGLRLKYVGVAFRNANGRLVEPDAVFHSDSKRSTLLVECKSGRNLDPGQIGRYEEITAEDVRDRLLLPVSDTSKHEVTPVIVCPAAHCREVAQSAKDMGHETTILGVGTTLELHGAPPPSGLAEALEGVGELDEDSLPAAFFLPFDRDSEKGDVARVVLPIAVTLLLAAAAGEGAGVSADAVLQQSHRLVHDSMLPQDQRSELSDLRKSVKDLLHEVLRDEWKRWVVFERGHVVLKAALDHGNDRVLQNLRRGAETYIARVEGREPPPDDEAQVLLPLYEPGEESDDE